MFVAYTRQVGENPNVYIKVLSSVQVLANALVRSEDGKEDELIAMSDDLDALVEYAVSTQSSALKNLPKLPHISRS
jgi:hypothetical protein